MSFESISSASLYANVRSSIQKIQAELNTKGVELSTGHLSDPGLTLGANTGRLISLRAQSDQMDTFLNSNAIMDTHLSTVSQSLSVLLKTAQDFQSTLLQAQNNPQASAGALEAQAQTSLNTLSAQLNVSANGVFVFSGQTTDQIALPSYEQTPPSPAQTAVDNAFSSAFGISQTDPAVKSLSASQVQSFLDGSFSTLFTPNNWKTTWSSTSSQGVQIKISEYEKAENPVTAQNPVFQQLAQIYTAVGHLGISQMNNAAASAVIQTASQQMTEAIKGLIQLSAQTGFQQARLVTVKDTLSVQKDFLEQQANTLDSVDSYKVVTDINSLQTQLQASYQFTALLKDLTLAHYL